MDDVNDHGLHRLYGAAGRRIAYRKSDYADYLLMLAISALVLGVSYQASPWLMGAGLVLCALMAVSFPLRHGATLAMPELFRQPVAALYSLLYKVQNIKPMFWVAALLLAADQLFIRATPGWPHHSALMGNIALGLFLVHLALLSLYRTVILAAHLQRRALVREILQQTVWKSALERQPNVVLHIVHAYVTGLLTHLILLAPWFLVITHARFSVISVAVTSVVCVLIHAFHLRTYSDWYYRDHWLAHNAPLDFVYLHGTHHDAIPCGLIGVSGNGLLEGFLRSLGGNPTSLYSPPIAFLLHTVEVLQDIRMHQYIPGIYPQLPRQFHDVAQHSTHHFGRLEPYGIGLRMTGAGEGGGRKNWLDFPPESIMNSIAIDERLNGFEWDNPRYKKFLELVDKYQK
ncbi:hypothetical protein KY495_22830 [Massilia sp. PAMC28688]|uniref:hypothetical protein n=1 Tax=Massilia sp. PAMC28688 TaxID=2861283 RepID=UPI001C634231|nr:hypothetical protein [Massilia sp. PAMC28688]QYF93463.1 hypothetical protein KY495_22830 [Massilia sp. PAMC28688]